MANNHYDATGSMRHVKVFTLIMTSKIRAEIDTSVEVAATMAQCIADGWEILSATGAGDVVMYVLTKPLEGDR